MRGKNMRSAIRHFIFVNVICMILVCILISHLSCSRHSREIMTVLGPVPAQDMGMALTHEHVLVDFIGADSTGYHRWVRETVEEKVLPYLMEAKLLGVNTFFECTPAFLGRDPLLLKSLSEKSELLLVTNTGYYGARQNQFIPEQAMDLTAKELAAIWIEEWENGIDDTGIKPGFIKIGVDRDSALSGMHLKLIRAAAITHLATGLTIVSHTGPEKPAFQQLAILEEEGVSPEAFVWVHALRGTPESHIQAAERGAWISLDNVTDDSTSIMLYTDQLLNMKKHGVLEKTLLSHDAGWYHAGEPEGGQFRNFRAIYDHLQPKMIDRGFTWKDVERILIRNPQEAFAVRVRRLE